MNIEDFEQSYLNKIQMLANVVDPNMLYCELGRATGKTEGVMTPRIIRVMDSMPGELSFLVHKTAVALISNVWPNIQASFARQVTVGGQVRPLLEEGIDYVAGTSNLPKHFRKPRYPVTYAKRSVIFRNGSHLQLVASDQPESVAGRNAVHAFIEEMKHNSGEKLRSRLFPALRGGSAEIRKSPYYAGVTGVSDTARVDIGEDAWFEEYEKKSDRQLISEIATVSLHLNRQLLRQTWLEQQLRDTRNPATMEKIRLEMQKVHQAIALWTPRLTRMRKNAVLYIRASSFANKDILGPKFFRTQLDTLDIDEFLTSICAIRHREVTNKFFAAYDRHRHQFSDSYKYSLIDKLSLKDHFTLTAHFLKHYCPQDALYVGYDPGKFSSLVVAQQKDWGQQLDVIKEFWSYQADPQGDLARRMWEFFGADMVNKTVHLYPDRAGNKSREELEQISTDSRIMKERLEQMGFSVILYNEGQGTIYHWQQYKLLQLLFGEQLSVLPRIRIDENECKMLCSAILVSPLKQVGGKIELDKSSERKHALKNQAGLTTQLPSAFIYLLYGLYSELCKRELSSYPTDLPDNISV